MNLKNVLIFGDSYSTFKGYIPEGYATYYSEVEKPSTDVRAVTETWWYPLMEETRSELVLNNSWSGSTIGFTGYNNSDCSKTSSFIHRLDKLTEEKFFEKNEINTVFIFGGTNDSWSNAPLGTPKYSDWQKEDLYCVLPAICYFIKRVKETLSGARVICIINTEIKAEIADCLEAASKYFGAESIRLKDIDKRSGHPTVKGMAQIKEQVMNSL